MKKKHLKALNLKRATISSLTAKTLNGGTDVITILIRTTDYATVGGCSGLAVCNSDGICPVGVPKTKFVDVGTKPASACMRDI